MHTGGLLEQRANNPTHFLHNAKPVAYGKLISRIIKLVLKVKQKKSNLCQFRRTGFRKEEQ